jgi:lantibiotic modifying enzyme
MFLRDRPGIRLGLFFRRFPTLARLWAVAIGQWQNYIMEILERTREDRAALTKTFFKEDVDTHIVDLRIGLSDSHHGGRSVSLIEFSKGQRIIYKPRTGRNESAWFALLGWMNRQGFQPEQRQLRMLVRKDYCWMEYAKPVPCSSRAAVRRFYERLGGLIAAAYLLKAVDCHRENLIAAGEHPILVDVDALWHVSPVTGRLSVSDVLYRTGFFPNARRGSLLSRSSVLGRSLGGSHLPRLAGQSIPPSPYAKEIISGFIRGWHCLIGNSKRRAAFDRIAKQIRSGERRWIHCATARYAAILRASLRPAVLRSNAERDTLITRLCSRPTISRSVARAERKALTELNIPYFNRRSRGRIPLDPNQPPSELILAIRKALEWTEDHN